MDKTESTKSLVCEICPSQTRYIKLGDGGRWEKECLYNGIVRFGFGTGTAERFALCQSGQWDALTQSFIVEGKDKGTATRFTNESRKFFEDDGSTLWITFHGERLWWGFLTTDAPKQHSDGRCVYRSVKDGWQGSDLKKKPLTTDQLSGALTKLAAYRGTSCSVDVADYVVRRINGKKMEKVARAEEALKEMRSSALELIKDLHFNDFEILVDLIFASSGWQRQGKVGGPQKTLDIDLMLPSTNEKAFVQVKSQTNPAELAEYVGRLEDHNSYKRMFFVFHSGNAGTDYKGDERVIVIGPKKLAEMIVDAGLVSWLIRKVG